MRIVASDVDRRRCIANSGHWLMEEQPADMAAITGFLEK